MLKEGALPSPIVLGVNVVVVDVCCRAHHAASASSRLLSPRSTTFTRSWRPCPRRSEPAESMLVVAGGCGAAGGVRGCRVCVVEWGVTMRLAELSFGPEEKEEEEKEDPPFNSLFLFPRHVCASCRRKDRENGDIGMRRGTTKAGGSWGERGTSERRGGERM